MLNRFNLDHFNKSLHSIYVHCKFVKGKKLHPDLFLDFVFLTQLTLVIVKVPSNNQKFRDAYLLFSRQITSPRFADFL